ncbi:hypothetical protein BDV30DRAFT_211263 [Aspergillus minisclerotigenes]|uniref:Heterokaryon incompatibility domain-containing protein n=1 Tax=Aspergillus minisclerotigenes TaxID=656917 RepID=A0A5N6J3U9_9EURO|nr:hypothetical protein BDV30DRAFT_211263 [Aspergillus minisclerotigenes]
MALIYENATLLISAARAATQNDGFLSAIDPEKIEHSELQFSLPFRYRHKGVQGYVVLDSLFGWDISGGKWRGKEPIHTRGWTMQEHLLSKRILAFGTTGVRWQCLYDMEYGSARWSKYTDVSEILSVSSNMNCRSCVSSRPNYEVKAPALLSVERIWRYHRDSLEPQYEWNQLRASYIARALSKAEDRLVAFSAIPRQFVSTLGSEQNYIAGHWQSQLPKDLLWDGTNLRSYRRGTFPSWSWVSRCGASGQSVGDSIFFQDTDGRETAQVWSADTELMDPNNPFGGVVSSKLLMCAKLLPVIVQFQFDKDNDEFEIQDVDLALSNKVPNVFAAQKYEFSGKLDGFYRGLSEAELMGETQPHGMPDHYLLEILQDTRTWPCWSHSQGLIVQSGRQDKGSLQEYTRIGTFELGCCAGASCHCHVHRKIKLEMRVKKARAPRRHNSPFDYHQEKTFYLC